MTVLGIDLGDKRCGIAIELNGIAFPKDIVSRVSIVSTVKRYCREYDCETIVVGLPYDLYGKDKKQLEKTQKFIDKLRGILPDKEVIGIDERFSSFEAEQVYKGRSQKRDDIAAQLILESYISIKDNKKQL